MASNRETIAENTAEIEAPATGDDVSDGGNVDEDIEDG